MATSEGIELLIVNFESEDIITDSKEPEYPSSFY